MKKTTLLFIIIFFVLGISSVYALQQQFSSKHSTVITPSPSPIGAIKEANHATKPSELAPEEKILENTGFDPADIGFTCDPVTGQCE